ncbi:uncharacterized protein LOC133806454 [Humulus lupulus]|uniref:uncharacterized protein LOC133806454 n=1 Tax=Humulus lupulus TaxID=3486 RepID=UPI002B4009CC|nr:uncharacterized protein LOC133806454 [Humulus lupulus]
MSLANVKQGENESLKSCIHRFNMETAKVGSLSRGELKMVITVGVCPGSKLWDNMLKRKVADLDDFYERLQIYIRVEDGHENLKVGRMGPSPNSLPQDTSDDVKKRIHDNPRDDRPKKSRHGNKPRPSTYTFYIELMNSREHIFITNENQVPLKKPPPMRHDRSKRDPIKYCQYHKDIGHTTAECTHLKIEIEELIRRGHLGRYVRRNNQRLDD